MTTPLLAGAPTSGSWGFAPSWTFRFRWLCFDTEEVTLSLDAHHVRVRRRDLWLNCFDPEGGSREATGWAGKITGIIAIRRPFPWWFIVVALLACSLLGYLIGLASPDAGISVAVVLFVAFLIVLFFAHDQPSYVVFEGFNSYGSGDWIVPVNTADLFTIRNACLHLRDAFVLREFPEPHAAGAGPGLGAGLGAPAFGNSGLP